MGLPRPKVAGGNAPLVTNYGVGRRKGGVMPAPEGSCVAEHDTSTPLQAATEWQNPILLHGMVHTTPASILLQTNHHTSTSVLLQNMPHTVATPVTLQLDQPP